jgi:hypothetical protein
MILLVNRNGFERDKSITFKEADRSLKKVMKNIDMIRG